MCCRFANSLLRPTAGKSVATSAVVHVSAGALAVIGTIWVSATQPARLPGQSRVIELQLVERPPEPESPAIQITVPEPVSLADDTPTPSEESVLVTPDRARLANRTFAAESAAADAWEMPDPTDPRFSERVAQLPLPARHTAPNAAAPPTETAPPIERTRAAHRPPQVSSAATPVPQQVGSDDQTPPDFSNNRPPRYPQIAEQRRWEGVVMLRITIAADGRVTRVEVAESSGHAVLDAEAVNTVRTWRGIPARRGGKPIETEELLPVRFRLR